MLVVSLSPRAVFIITLSPTKYVSIWTLSLTPAPDWSAPALALCVCGPWRFPPRLFRVPLTQVYPMALPLPPFLSLNLSLWLWDGLEIIWIFLVSFFSFIALGIFLRFLIVIFYHKVSWNSTVHDFLKMLIKQSMNYLKIFKLSQHSLKISHNFLS